MAEIIAILRGGPEMQRALDELRGDLRRRVVRAALRDAAAPIVRAARQFAPVLKTPNPRRVAGTLRRNIKAFGSKRYKVSQGAIGVYIKVRASKKDLRNAPITGDPYYWRWLEGGHKIVPRKGKGRSASIAVRRRAASRKVRPYPFLGPAFTAKGDEARRIFETAIFKRIDEANRKK